MHEIRASSSTASELSLHLLRAQEEERKRISRELHDETGQGLMVLRLCLSALTEEVRGSEGRAKIEQALQLLDHTIGDLRRLIARLSPRVLEELGLLAAVRREARELSRNTGMQAHLNLPQALDDLGQETEVVVYRCVQEALHNVAKHSRAHNFRIRIDGVDRTLHLVIEDDGIGIPKRGHAREGSYGLLGMRERVAALGGTVRLRARAGKGTALTVKLPLRRTVAGPRHETRHDALGGIARQAS